jgi:hypothetical protein
MNDDLRFRIRFLTPFRVGSGYGRPGADAAIDLHDQLPADTLKGIMRATALQLGLAEPVRDAAFGTPATESPWNWGDAVAAWTPPALATRVRLDAHHTAVDDMLVTAEQVWAAEAEFTVRLAGACAVPGHDADEALALHRALLAVSGQATRSLGADRRRGLGQVRIRCLDLTPTRDDIARLLGVLA